MPKKFNIDPEKPFFIYDTHGDWHATVIDSAIWDLRGEYIGFIQGEEHEVLTTSGEWIGNLIVDGRIVKKRSAQRRPLQQDMPPRPQKPDKLPPRAPLPPMSADIGFTYIDVLEWDPEIFKRLSDMTPDKD